MWVFYLFTGSVIVIFAAGLVNNPNHMDNCGHDFTGSLHVVEGQGLIENYPWVGILLFPIGGTLVTSVVVLVTRQMVIGSASEIDNLPKDHFRALSRVVLGTNSSGPRLKIREYTYHGEYGTETYSSLALIQLELEQVKFDFRPICGPPTHFYNMDLYAISLNEDSLYPVLTIQQMEHVNSRDCKQFYRRNGLDLRSIWPTYTTCARAISGKECVWRGGAVLAAKLGGRWHLFGFGVNGPGCHAPSRFIDYGPYVSWLKRSVEKIGNPAVTRLGPGHVILRRSISSLQRYGQCDREEVIRELYTDQIRIVETDKRHKIQRVRYNVSLHDELEYTCVIFEVFHHTKRPAPFLRLRRWCAAPTNLCYGFQFIQIDFYVEIEFVGPMTFKMAAYGRHPTVIDVKQALKYYYNHNRYKPNRIANEEWKRHLNEEKHLYWTRNLNNNITTTTTDDPNILRLTPNEALMFEKYLKYISSDSNRNQRFFNRTIALSEPFGQRSYFGYLWVHSLYNPDNINNTIKNGSYSAFDHNIYKQFLPYYANMSLSNDNENTTYVIVPASWPG